jgi:hypothetical protein
VVVEVKRPGLRVGRNELEQLERYVDYLTDHNATSTLPTGTLQARARVTGCLVYSHLDPAAENKKARLSQDGMYVVSWDGLLETAERPHREFLDVVKLRAPQDDPRIQALDTGQAEQPSGAADGDAGA